MANAGSLIVSLMLDSTRYAAGLSETTKKTNRTVKQIQREIKGLVNFAVGAGGLYAVVRGFQAVTQAAAAQEEATLRLSQALKNNYQFTGANLKALEDQASALQKVTRYGDETITGAQALLIAVGRLDAEGVRKLTPSLLDFATAMGMDLNSAASLLGKTVGSSTNALARYGIQIDMSKDSTAKLAELQAKLQAQFGKQSEIEGYTTNVIHLKNAIGDLNEEIGFMITGKAGGAWAAMGIPIAAIAESLNKARTDLEFMRKFAGAPQGMDPTGMGNDYYTAEQRALAEHRAKLYYASQEAANAREKETAERLARAAADRAKREEEIAAAVKKQADGMASLVSYRQQIQQIEFSAGGMRFSDSLAPPRLTGFTDADIDALGPTEAQRAMQAARDAYRVEEDVADWYRLVEAQGQSAERMREIEREAIRFGDYWGSVMYGAVSQSGNAFENILRMFEDMIAQMAVRAAIAGIFNAVSGGAGGFAGGFIASAKGLLGFANGGYTGTGSPNAVAGYVHRGEYVVPSDVVGRYGSASFDRLIAALEGGGGGYTDQSVNSFNLSGFSSDMTIEQFAAKYNAARRHRLIA